MGVTTRAAAQQQRSIIAQATAQLAHNRLLNLPDAVLERILVAASNGGRWRCLHDARLVCRRLRAVAYTAAREFEWHVPFLDQWASWCGGITPLSLPRRLGALTELQLHLGLDDEFNPSSYWSEDDVDILDMAQSVAQSFSQ